MSAGEAPEWNDKMWSNHFMKKGIDYSRNGFYAATRKSMELSVLYMFEFIMVKHCYNESCR